jgi:alanine-glyoxylate transaminase/serine-glyoxylate transaminase/serine-pyruvate transaminase
MKTIMAKNKPLKLMIPGPVQPEDTVLEAIGEPVRPHYGPEWRDYYNETTAYLKKIFSTNGDVFIMVGSGSAGIDACIGSTTTSGEKIIVGSNGFFGERIQAISECYGLNIVLLEQPWGKLLLASDFVKALDTHPDAKMVAVVHLETSTTIINPIAEIGNICRERSVPFFVDAVSSLGGLPLHMDEWGIDLCASGSQKCLGAPPGLTPVAVGKHGWDAINNKPAQDHGWYLNLSIWRQYAIDWGDWHPFPVTMATNNVVALHTSLESLMAEGIEKRLERYTNLALRLREGLRKIGMYPFTPDDQMAPVLTAAYGPKGIPTSLIVDYLADVHNIKIAGGLGELKDRVFRIGHMSPTVSKTDIDEVLDALEDCKLNLKQ